MRRLSFVAVAFLVAMLASGVLFAQTQTGTITGKVTDETGAVLPGVTVTVTSPALIQPRTTSTTEEGNYQFVNLPPGFYVIQFELPGFATLSFEDIRIQVGFVARINATMKIASVAETVTVTGESPVVDVKNILKTTRFDTSLLDNIPSARDPWVLAAMVPGAQPSLFNVGGTESFQQYGVQVHGSDSSASINIDGLLVNWTGGSTMLYYDFSMYEEMSFQTNAQPAEVESPGMSWNMVTASGGNQWSGEGFLLFMNRDMTSDNVSEQQRAKGITANPVDLSWDLNAKVGGPIIKDKIWVFGTARYWRMDQVMGAARLLPGQKEWIDDNSIRNFFGKVTYQINPSNTLTYNWNRNYKYRYHRLATDDRSYFSTPEATYLQDQISNTTQGKFTSVLSDRAFLDVRGGVMFGTFPTRWQKDVDRETTIPKEDIGTRTYYDAPPGGFEQPNWRLSISGAYSYFLDNFLGGVHNIKTGLQFGRCFSRYEYRYNKYGLRQRYNYGQPLDVYLYNYPVNTEAMWNSYGLYLQDDFTLKDRLTLNLGVRYDRYHGWVPAHSSPAGPWFPERTTERIDDVPLWNNAAHRLGFAFDVFGDGKTAIKGNYSRYYGRLTHSMILDVDPTGTGTDRRTWSDLNGDNIAQIEELGPSTGWRVAAKNKMDPDLRNDYEDEMTLGVERELFTDFRLGVTYYHRESGDRSSVQNILVTPADYQPVLVNNPLTGEKLQVWQIDAAKRAAYQGVYRNNPLDWNDYNGVEITATKRYSHGWQLMGGITIQKNWGGLNYSGTQDNDPGDPNNQIFREGYRGNDSTYAFNLVGSYRLPHDIMFSGNFRHQTGYPLDVVLQVTGLNQGTFPVRPVERGDYRLDDVTMLDFRASKTFSFGTDYKLELMLDLYNALNTNVATRVNTTVGANFFDPIMIMTPRTIRVGGRFTF